MHMPLLFAALDRHSQGRLQNPYIFEQKVGGLVYTFSSHEYWIACRHKDRLVIPWYELVPTLHRAIDSNACERGVGCTAWPMHKLYSYLHA